VSDSPRCWCVGDFAAATPRLRELDLNPVIANAEGILPVDVRIVLADLLE
jgi:acetyltransferase